MVRVAVTVMVRIRAMVEPLMTVLAVWVPCLLTGLVRVNVRVSANVSVRVSVRG